jgi:hypothetical protein
MFMKDVYLLLRQKESDLARLRVEIDSLRLVAPLLTEEPYQDQEVRVASPQPDESFQDPQSTGTDGPLSSVGNSESRFWGLMKRSREK